MAATGISGTGTTIAIATTVESLQHFTGITQERRSPLRLSLFQPVNPSPAPRKPETE